LTMLNILTNGEGSISTKGTILLCFTICTIPVRTNSF